MTSIICANRTGGQGKSLVAQLVALGYDYSAKPLRKVAADIVDDGDISKFGRFFPGQVTELKIGATIQELRDDERAALREGDRVGEQIVKGDCVIDLGANVVDSVWQWANARSAGAVLEKRGIEAPVLVVPCTSNGQAVADAVALLEKSFKQTDDLPISARFLVLNERDGNFDKYTDDDAFSKIEAMTKKGLKLVRLRKCRSEVWPEIERKFIPFAELAEMESDDFEKRFDLSVFAASGAHSDLLEWLKESIESFREAGLIPSAPAAKSYAIAADGA